MAQVSVNYPVIGQPNSTEDPKVLAAFQALVTAINGLDNANIASNANINASKLLDGSIAAAKLATDAVETAKIKDGNVTTAKIGDSQITTAKIGDSQVTTDKINDGAVTEAKIAASTTVAATPGANNDLNSVVARRYANGQVLLSGSVLRVSGTWSGDGTTITTLPVGFRPVGLDAFAMAWSGSIVGANAIIITTAGEIQIRGFIGGGRSAGLLVLDGVTFHAG
jgi:hypothetical protein